MALTINFAEMPDSLIDIIFFTDGSIKLTEPSDPDEGWTHEELSSIVEGHWTVTWIADDEKHWIICREDLNPDFPPINERASRHAGQPIHGTAMLVWRENFK